MSQADIAVIGLAVMGENLVLNMESKGFTVAVYNRTADKVTNFVEGRAKGKNIIGTTSLEELVKSLKSPRKIMIMIKAGGPVDAVIDTLTPLLDKGDILIDGGNTNFPDSSRRTKALGEKGLLYVGTGVSGGEEGALKGPSLMPGGAPEAWTAIKPIFQGISAKTDDGEPCCDWVGNGGAGHFVKMVHNGIEYGDMQLICEAYQIMKEGLGMSYEEMHDVFDNWNKGDLDSYLIEISRDILAFRDENGEPLLESILDTAGQKGTGKWTGITALDLGVPLTLIGESVFARCLSSIKEERVEASKIIPGPTAKFEGDKKAFIDDLGKALYASKLVSYAQGYSLMRTASDENNWELNYGSVALMWRGGCIIRSGFLGKIRDAYAKNADLPNLLQDQYFTQKIDEAQGGWRNICAQAAMLGVPLPAMSSALAYFDGYRSARLPANLLQAQRDYFGAHMYERTDKPRGKFFHTNWTGRGASTASSAYNV